MQKVRVGIDMGGTTIKIGLVKDGYLLNSRLFDASSQMSLAKRLEEVEEEVEQLINAHEVTIEGIGIAFPGIVDHRKNKILSNYVKYPDAQLIDLNAHIREKWKVPFVLENDARAALLGEWQYGAGKNYKDLVLVTFGTGVGTAVILDHKVLRGKNSLAGNLGGHMSINFDGRYCSCGNIGCLETEGSTWALKSQIKEEDGFSTSSLSSGEIDFKNLFNKAEDGDALAIKTRDRCLNAWATGIINLINAYDPEVILIGGGVMNSQEIILPYIRKRINENSWFTEGEVCIMAAKNLESAAILGINYLLTRVEL